MPGYVLIPHTERVIKLNFLQQSRKNVTMIGKDWLRLEYQTSRCQIVTAKEVIRKCNVAMLGGYNAGVLTRMEMRIGTPALTTVLQTVLKKVYSVACSCLVYIGILQSSTNNIIWRYFSCEQVTHGVPKKKRWRPELPKKGDQSQQRCTTV